MVFRHSRIAFLMPLLILFLALPIRADVEGESLLTPNQERHFAQVNEDLPADIQDQSSDTHAISDLRARLRRALWKYKQMVKEFGSGTLEAREAAHFVMEEQKALHTELVREEAIPAITQIPQ